MKNLRKVYNLNLGDYLNIYQKLGFKAEIIKEKDIECVLLSDTDSTPSYIVYVSTSASALNYDDVKDILIDLELEFQGYNCSNYILISENGYLNKSYFIKDKKVNVYDIQSLKIKLEDSSYIEELIKASSSDQKYFELNSHNKIAYINIKESFLSGHNRVCVRHATGTGKSILVSKYISQECDGNIILLSSSVEILNQFTEHLSSSKLKQTKMLTYNKLSFMDDCEFEYIKSLNPELIVLDEFHRCGAKTWGKAVDKLLNICSNARILGTTATSIRYLDGARDMGYEIFNGNMVSDISLCEAIVRGILPMPIYVTAMYDFNETIENLNNKISAFECSRIERAKLDKKIEVLDSISKSSSLVKGAFNKHIKNNRNFVVFCRDIEHLKSAKETVSQWFSVYMNDNNINCNINSYELYSGNSDNKYIVSSYIDSIENNTNNDFNLLFSIDMANEGIHSKYIDGVILLRPTKSPIVYYQQIGRALHVNPVNNPIIFDFVNNSDYIQTQNFITGLAEAYDNVNNNTHLVLEKIKNIDVFLENIYDESKDIVDMLNDIEDVIKVDWDAMFDELTKFKNKKGTTIVRASDNYRLSRWVQKNRYMYLNNMLSDERKVKLDSIGFVVSAQEAIWLEHYESLKEYKSIYGDINVSSDYNLKLHRFVKYQRRLYEQGILSKERIALLENFGMIWNLVDHKWESKFSELTHIYNKIGSLYIVENDPVIIKDGIVVKIEESLMHWISCQRKYFTNGTLSQDRVKRLTSLGLALNLREKSWNDNMTALKLFIQVNGHANVTSNDGKKLYLWVKSLRRKKVSGELDENIVKELDSLGFTWSRRDSMWEEKFSKYISYKNTYGTPIMEKGCAGFNSELDRWIKSQRKVYKAGELSEYRVNKLNEAGFVWDVLDYKWMIIYNELKSFILSIGEGSYRKDLLSKYEGNMPLRDWVSTQRKCFMSNSLSERRLGLLLEIGINFDGN